MTGADGVTPRSRLDRFLAPPEMCQRALKWGHEASLGISDHSVATAEFIDNLQPESGKVRWKMAVEEINDPRVLNQTRECLLACQKRIARGEDPMGTWIRTKDKIKKIFESVKRSKAKERTSRLSNLEGDLRRMRMRADYQSNSQVRSNAEAVEARIAEIRRRIAEKSAETQTARYHVMGETVSKYWFSTGKPLQSSNMVRSLKNAEGDRVTDTRGMLEVMAEHHESLMARPEMTLEREETIDNIYNLAARTTLSPGAKALLGDPYSEEDVKLAIGASHNGKAPGKDGFIYEFYKTWLKLYEADGDSPKSTPSILYILKEMWNAPSKRKEAPAEYVEGLMALAYKKGDKELPENYRPLTLLNTDYKLETKCLATCMGRSFQEIIHKDQAGFVPGRDILDHVKMAQMVAEYCEVTEQDGCLIALDQEKAYDRIDHEYLDNTRRVWSARGLHKTS